MTAEQQANLSGISKFGISLGSGLTAGAAAAVLSQVCPLSCPPFVFLRYFQPADTLLSQVNKGHGPTGPMMSRLIILAREAGFKGLFAGLGPRMVMVSGLVAGQFLVYGAVKNGEESTHAFAFVSPELMIYLCSSGRSSWN